MTTTAAPGGPAPSTDEPPAAGYGGWVSHDIPYNQEFEDSLIDVILNGAGSNDIGIRVIPEDSDEQPVEGVSVRFQDIDLTALPTLHENDLPIPLSDPRRIYASAIPGIKLTHPYGWAEGGPSLDPNYDTFPDDFLKENPHITTSERLHSAVRKEVEVNLEVVRERLRARQKAKEKNEQLAKEIKTLTDQHDMEMRIQQRMQEQKRRKNEAKGVKKDGG